MNILEKIALVFTIVGGINWGLVGIFDYNLVDAIFGAGSIVARIIYIVIAVCALVNVLLLFMPLDDKQSEKYHEDYPRKRATNN